MFLDTEGAFDLGRELVGPSAFGDDRVVLEDATVRRTRKDTRRPGVLATRPD
jgi:hypothetical protein